MITLDYQANVANTRVVLARVQAKTFWDPAKGWTPAPADGTIPASCVQIATPMATKGPTQYCFSWACNIDPNDVLGASALVFSVDSAGNLGNVIDLYSSPWLISYEATRGGWNRL